MSNILFLNRNFYIYDNKIKDELEKRGNNVYAYSLLPKYTNLQKIKLHISNDYYKKKYAKKQQMKILKDIKKKKIIIDVVFVLAGQDLLPSTLETLKKLFSEAKFVWYMWDNTNKLSEYKDNKLYFDTIISFDIIEAKKENLEYLPLFYIKEENRINKIYDLCFIGADHSVRKEIIKNVLKQYKFDKVFIYLLSNKFNKIKSFFSKKHRECVSFLRLKELNYEKVIEVMASSKCILDIPNPNQTGLTMRTIEAMGVHSKLITTNKAIKKYDFYNKDNIFILDEESDSMNIQEFLLGKYSEVDENIIKEYDLEHWISKLCKSFIS